MKRNSLPVVDRLWVEFCSDFTGLFPISQLDSDSPLKTVFDKWDQVQADEEIAIVANQVLEGIKY